MLQGRYCLNDPLLALNELEHIRLVQNKNYKYICVVLFFQK